jgi:solute carrier family 6 serotonin transporter-like protein 4
VFAWLQVIFIFSLLGYEEMLQGDYKYPAWTIMVGWILTASSLLCIPLYIVYKFIVTPGNIVQVLLPDSSSSVLLVFKDSINY